MKTKESKKSKSPCEKYRLDIADYATGDSSSLTPEKEKELIQHLKECKSCQEAFLDYEDICATMVTEKHTKSPEFRKKMDETLEMIKQMKPSLPPSPTIEEIIRDAETLYSHIPEKEPTTLDNLMQKTGMHIIRANRAITWLASQKRVNFKDEGQNTYVTRS